MVHLYRAADTEDIAGAGYSARYIADIKFRSNLDNGGFILVTIPAGVSTTPHSHGELEEVFIAWTSLDLHVNERTFHLAPGDIALIEPGENHSFTASLKNECRLMAIKFPNLKDDKTQQVSS
jgi:quercetin dioxygenase-like cupin family protein